ncbi:MAG: Fe-S cluster assembly protein SufD [Dongiaceae bacterium]
MPLARRSIPLPYADGFAAVSAKLPGANLAWLGDLRARSAMRFVEAGLPTPRVERWKYTNLNGLAAARFSAVNGQQGAVSISSLPPPLLADSLRLVFVNGRLRRDLSNTNALPAGIRLLGLAEALDKDPELVRPYLAHSDGADEALSLLNLAFMTDGVVLVVAPGTRLEVPIELSHVGLPDDRPVALHGRNLIKLEAGSQATMVESFYGEAIYWTDQATRVDLAEGSQCRHYKAQADSTNAYHTASTTVRAAAASRYESFVLTTGAGLSRNEIKVSLDGEGASCRLGGSYLMRGRQHVDNTTEIIHAKPRTTSEEVYKGVLDDRSRGVFQGRIVVQPDAQKSDGHQLNKTILLSDRAEIDTKPELEIYADDVKCGHGATAGELDDDALFYLRARGIDLATARRMLVAAFIGEAIETISHEAVRVTFDRQVQTWMAADGTHLS